jgi:hypothetical protein
MPRNGVGTYTLPAGNPVVTGTVISVTWSNTTLADIADALTNSLAADGQTVVQADLPMNSKKITGLAAGTASTDAVNKGQLDARALSGTYTPTASGVVNGSCTPYACFYCQIANHVVVSGHLTFEPTASGATEVELTMPVEGLSRGSTQVSGSGAVFCSGSATPYVPLHVRGAATGAWKEASLRWTSPDTSPQNVSFMFSYDVTAYTEPS